MEPSVKARLDGYGESYFDNISFDYLYALIPEDKSPEWYFTDDSTKKPYHIITWNQVNGQEEGYDSKNGV